jgi:hypothetical protein
MASQDRKHSILQLEIERGRGRANDVRNAGALLDKEFLAQVPSKSGNGLRTHIGSRLESLVYLVAGAGFEPATFGL